MADLTRTNIGSPFYNPSRPVQASTARQTSSALANMAAIGGAVASTVARQQEVNAVLDANNDLVNNSINPDKMMHQSAYAKTVAEGQALQNYNTLKQEVLNGAYDDMDPEEFQRMQRERHQAYAQQWENNPVAGPAMASYNEFALKNDSSLTAAQAGKWRTKMGANQAQAMRVKVQSMIESGTYTAADYKAVVEDPTYSLVGTQDRLNVVLLGAGDHAGTTGDSSVLQELDKEYGFSTSVTHSHTYSAAIKAANRKAFAVSAQDKYETLAHIRFLEDEGMLSDAQYPLVRELKDENGRPLYTQEKFLSAVQRSKVNLAKKNATAQYRDHFKAGHDMSAAPKKDFNSIANDRYAEHLRTADGNPVVALENMGRELSRQTHMWDLLRDRSRMFLRRPMMINNEVNPEALQQYHELEALERGMQYDTNGEKVFAKYLGDSLPQYLAIKSRINSGGASEEADWKAVATSLELQRQETKRREKTRGVSQDARIVGQEAVEGVLAEENNPFVPDFLEFYGVPEDDGARVAAVAAVEYDRVIDEGFDEGVARQAAMVKAHSQTYSWGGELYDTGGHDPKILFGTVDPEGAFNTMIEDPMWSAQLKTMFGVYMSGGAMVPLGEVKVDAPGLFTGDKIPVTPEEIREQKRIQQELIDNDRVILRTQDIKKELDFETGMVNFKSPYGRRLYSIPMEAIGAVHNAKLQGIENITELERLYSPEHLKTDEGRDWHDKQSDLNDTFLNEVLLGEAGKGRDHVSAQEYAGMPQIEKTRERLKFHNEYYTGMMGKVNQIFDFFKNKLAVDTAPELTEFVPVTPREIERNKEMIKEHEGLSLTVYKDTVGKETIGYGHLMMAGEAIPDTITQAEADAIFDRDYEEHFRAASKMPTFNEVSSTRQAALVDLTFNMGASWYKKFPKFMRAFEAGDYETAADELVDSKWYKQVGRRGPKIVSMIREG